MKRGWEDLPLEERIVLRYLSGGEATPNGCPFCERRRWTGEESMGNLFRLEDGASEEDRAFMRLWGSTKPVIHMCSPMYGKLGEALWHAIGLEDEQFRALDWSTLIAVIDNTEPNLPETAGAADVGGMVPKTTRNVAIIRYMQAQRRLKLGSHLKRGSTPS